MRSLSLIIEGSRDNLLLKFLPKVQEVHPDCTLSVLKKFLLNKFVNEGHIRALSMPSNFYLSGVARYYFNGDLTTNKTLNIFDETVEDQFIEDVCSKLSALIRVLRDKYLDSEGVTWEQPEDFGILSLQRLFKKYGKAIEKELGLNHQYDINKNVEKKPKTINANVNLNNYTFEIIYNQEELQKYENPTSPGSWCVTYGLGHYNGYTRRNNSFFVVFKENGWENIKRPTEEPDGFPLDAYGVSLIAIQLSKSDGHIVGGTTRWNHGANGINVRGDADGKVDFDVLHRLTGITENQLKEIRDVWANNAPILCKSDDEDTLQVNVPKETFKDAIRLLNYIQICINDGQNPFLETRAFPNGLLSPVRILDSGINKLVNTDVPGFDVEEFARKNWKKCCLLVSVNVEDFDFYAVMDRGKIYSKESINTTHNVRRCVKSNFNKNISIIDRPNDKFSLYDMARHKMLRINEKFIFQDIDLACFENVVLVKIGVRQYCIYDNKNGKFVEKDGYNTFEYITLYNSEMIVGTKNDSHRESRFLNVIIDSSAKKFFILDCNDMTTIELEDGFIPDYGWIVRRLSDKGFCVIEKCQYDFNIQRSGQCVGFRRFYSSYGQSAKHVFKIFNANEKDFLKIGDKDTFDGFNILGDRFVYFKPDEEKVFRVKEKSNLNDLYSNAAKRISEQGRYFFDLFKNELVNVNGETFLRGDYSYGSSPFIFYNENNDYKIYQHDPEKEILTGKLGNLYISNVCSMSAENYFFSNLYDAWKYVILNENGPLTDENGEVIVFDDYTNVYRKDENGFYGRIYENNEWKFYEDRDNNTCFLEKKNNEETRRINENFYRLVNYNI